MKLGILTCSTVTQDLACSSFNCLEELKAGKGEFAAYNGDAQLVGIINCAGCGTFVAPDKLLKRIRSLTELNVEAIHLSTCMMNICPFMHKYQKLLADSFPHIRIVLGTHGPPAGIKADEFKTYHQEMVKSLIAQGETMADIIPLLTHAVDNGGE